MTTPPIIVGVDGSESSERALLWAADLAVAVDTTLLVVLARTHPAPITSIAPGPIWPWPIVNTVDESELASTRTLLADSVAAVLPEDHPVSVEVVVRDGAAAQVLIEETRAVQPQLLVVGRRGIGGFKRLLLGSVSDECARYATCPVAVISKPTDNRDAAPVVAVGIDGSTHGYAALEWAAQTATRLGYSLAVLHAYEIPQAPPGSIAATLPQLESNFDSLGEVADELVEDAVQRVRSSRPELTVTGQVLTGYPSELLVGAADRLNAAMLVLGSRGMGGFASLMLGSVADQALHHSDRPIVVVRAAEGE